MERRQLRFAEVSDLRRELETICTHRVKTLGAWNEAQIVQHVTRLMEFSYNGFPFRAPWYARLIARRFLPRFLNKGFTPGFKLPSRAGALLPDDAVTLAAAAAQMAALLGRLERGEPMSQPSPIFGPLTHEQWVQLHLRHAEHHFSFVIIEEQSR